MHMKKAIAEYFSTLAVGCVLLLPSWSQQPATITVDASAHGYAIPADFLGLSFERGTQNSGNAGVPGYLFSPTNSELITLVQNLGLKNIRVGGGSVDTEVLVKNTASDNLFQFASPAGVKIIYTVRMLNTKNKFPNLKQQDAAIAGYIWRRYQPLVSNFAVGNEPDWHSYHVAGDPAIYETTPKVPGTAYPSYLLDWRNFVSTILSVTPGASFSGPDTGAYDSSTDYDGASWTEHFANDEMDSGILADATQHYYVGGGPKTTTSTQAIDNMLSSEWVNNTSIGTQPTGLAMGRRLHTLPTHGFMRTTSLLL